MVKIVLIILCAVMFAGMLSLDFIISKVMNKPAKKDENDDDSATD